jgi:hypothetical protein
MKTKLPKLGVTITVVVTLGVSNAGSAAATMATQEAEWYIGSPTATLTKDETATLKLGKHQLLGTPEPETKARFTMVSGATTYEFTATGAECVECKITNGATNAEKAMAEEKLRFTGVTVMKPEAACKVKDTAGGTIGQVTTNALREHSDWKHEGKAFVSLEPKAGPTNAFVTLQIVECSFATSLVVKGALFGEALNKPGVAAKEHTITFSKAIHETTGSTINVGGNTVIVEAQAIGSLASGAEFGAK